MCNDENDTPLDIIDSDGCAADNSFTDGIAFLPSEKGLNATG